MTRMPWARAWVLLLALASACARASTSGELSNDDLTRLANMSLEQLMSTRVTSVAGRPESRFATPAALTVLTAEDIRRNGFRSVAEALRMVPGMFVGQVNASSWVIGARGLTGSALTATRYLVLIDGRLVYDPLVSTTFWDVVDFPVADLDRIEVIRGPGSTLWGVNAMNGVVNIITKKAVDTLGTRVEIGAGSNDESTVMLRHGAALDADTAFNVWAKYDRHGDFENAAGDSIEDQWSALHGGFRLDGHITEATTYTLEGDAYTHPTAHESALLPVPGVDRQFQRASRNDTVNGGSLLFRALNGFGEDRGWLLRAYAARTERDTTRFGVRRDTVDVEYRDWMPLNDANQLIWGVQYDSTRDVVDNGPVLLLDPASRGWSTLNAFVQDTAVLVPDTLFFMAGTKLTQHSFVGFQTQPSVRLWWTPSERQTWWAALSRPVRVPSRFEEDGLLVFSYADRGAITTGTPDGVIVPLGLSGNEDLRPEKLLAWEVGHRIQANADWAFDTTLFYNRYQRLLGVPQTIIGTFTDNASGATWGGDVSVSGRLSNHWRVEGSYSRLRTRIDGPVLQFDENSTPEVMAQVHSYWDVGPRLELNATLYHVGAVPFVQVDAYNRADVGLTWRPSGHAEYALWGQNLLAGGHSEMSGAQVPRGVFVQATFNLDR